MSHRGLKQREEKQTHQPDCPDRSPDRHASLEAINGIQIAPALKVLLEGQKALSEAVEHITSRSNALSTISFFFGIEASISKKNNAKSDHDDD
jgi:hypothetical protein